MPDNCRGFSLMEVLIAFVILALSLGVMMQIFSGGLRNAGIVDDYGFALSVAESRLAAMGVETPLEEGSERGEVDRKFLWQMDVRPYMTEMDSAGKSLPPYKLYQVQVEVSWHNIGADRSISLTSLRVTPR